MKLIFSILVFSLISFSCNSQVIFLSVKAISKSTQSPDRRLMTDLKGEWIIDKVEIDGEDITEEFSGVLINFPKCKKKEYKAGNCQYVEVTGDENTEYFKDLFADESKISITSRKEINKEAEASNEDYEKVKYELISTNSGDYEYIMKIKEKRLFIKAVSEDHSESFELSRPEKKKKSTERTNS